MNLGEFLQKIKTANIYESDLSSKQVSHPQAFKAKERVGLERFSLPVEGITINRVTATAMLEETMALLHKCKTYERELEKRDSIIQQAIVRVG